MKKSTFLPSTSVGGLWVLVTLTLAGCGGEEGNALPPVTAGSPPVVNAALSPQAALGKLIFSDQSLSANGRQSCASCHDQAHAFAGTSQTEAVPPGGTSGTKPGFRNTPSIKYLVANPAFFFDSEGTPTGGFNRDGRAASLLEQARRPFLTAHEMANASATDVSTKLSRASYAAQFRIVFGDQIFSDPEAAFERALFALQRFQQEDTADFAPYSSKYDAFLDGRAQFTTQELRGFALFNDPTRGNCAGCHPSGRIGGIPPLFTDFTYDNLGVPRNSAIPANADPGYFDLGLCGPQRQDLAARGDLCGAFKVPTLRNVALTAPYFHNGRFATLTDVVRFYVRRDTNPEEWYPTGPNGLPQKFNDLPPQYMANVNTTEVPYNRRPGDAPALDENQIQDVVAFLQTLTDGYQP